MSDRSFVRFGGLAGILLALTSWAAVVAYATVAEGGANVVGLQIFQLLYALVAFWSIFGIVAVYYRVRPVGEAWAFATTLVGVAAAVGTLVAAMFEVANLRQLEPAAGPSAANPLGVLTYGLTGLWFLLANLLLWTARAPRALVVLGFIAAADLLAAFVWSLAEANTLVVYAAFIAGAFGGPVYWLWLGLVLRREA